MNFLDTFAPRIKQNLAVVLGDFLSDAQEFVWDKPLIEQLTPLVQGGKMFRGSLFWAMYEQLADQPKLDRALPIATALELFGSALLIQDDILDQDQLRRGLPTLHHTYQQLPLSIQPQLSSHQKAVFGTGLALTVADLLLFTANNLLINVPLAEKTRLQLLRDAAVQFNLLVLAQAEDLRLSLLPLKKEAFTQAEIERMFVRKTSLYSVEWPLSAAFIAAGKTDFEVFKPLAQKLGLLYQLVDDKLGLFGDPQQTGKETLTDVRQGKKTLYALFALEDLRGAEQQFFLQVYGNPDATPTQINQLRKLFEKQGVVERVERRIQLLRQELEAEIQVLPKTFQPLLSEVMQMVANRNK